MMEAGYECIGATLKLCNGGSRCCSLEDVNDARLTAARLAMPHYVLNGTEAFERDVIGRFIAAYEKGDTPNPCIDCNRFIKWPLILRKAGELGFDCIATGHYARIVPPPGASRGRWLLKKGLDKRKDQSYVLYMLSQGELARTRLPLGGMTKEEVRALAAEKRFVNARKEESQDICFVSDGDYGGFIDRRQGRPFAPGEILDSNGAVIGRHGGYQRYTIGQRRGLGVAANAPLYVCAKDPARNTVTLGPAESLYSHSFVARAVNLIACDSLPSPTRLTVMTRYQAREAPCTVQQTDSGALHATFDEPQRAVTPGQAAVFYDGDTVVGGGTISEVE
jgi:tRNA-specific 2-thiouridylase